MLWDRPILKLQLLETKLSISLEEKTENPHHYSERVGVVDPGGVVNLYALWDWVGMEPRMEPESRSCTFPLVQKSC